MIQTQTKQTVIQTKHLSQPVIIIMLHILLVFMMQNNLQWQ